MISFPPADRELSALAERALRFTLDRPGESARLDEYVAGQTGLSMDRVEALIAFGSIWVNDKVCLVNSRLLAQADRVRVNPPVYGIERFYEINPARIIYRDEWLLAYDKEPGIPAQQVPYDGYNHLYGALKRYAGPGAYLGLHHRLDRLTSGLMLFTARPEANAGLGRLFREGGITKIYLAVAAGSPEHESWVVDKPIARRQGGYYCPSEAPGKAAQTAFTVLERGSGRVLIQARPRTGRTHQIRLHLAVAGHPILGDETYGGPAAPRLMLHARSLSFPHPATGEFLTIEAAVPEDFNSGIR